MIGHEELLLISMVSSHHVPRVQIPGHIVLSQPAVSIAASAAFILSSCPPLLLTIVVSIFLQSSFSLLEEVPPQLYAYSMLINMMIPSGRPRCPKNAFPSKHVHPRIFPRHGEVRSSHFVPCISRNGASDLAGRACFPVRIGDELVSITL